MMFDNNKIKANHIRWKHKSISFSDIGRENIVQNILKINELRFGKWITEEIPCHNCGKLKVHKYRDGKRKEKNFCSSSCANKRIHSEKTKKKIEESTRIVSIKLWNDEEYTKKQLNRNKVFSSKGEREVRNYFIEKYPDHGWTFGGGIKYNDVPLTRDMYSNILKICVEYDGIWHFKDIHNQLKEKKKKDNYLEKWCKENGYRMIRIKDELYLKDKQAMILKIEKAIYESTDNLIKLY